MSQRRWSPSMSSSKRLVGRASRPRPSARRPGRPARAKASIPTRSAVCWDSGCPDGDNRRVATRVSASRLIGRAGELAELEAAFDEAASGAASLAFVAGESGVGKSRLLHTFLDRAREKGGCGIGGECVELARDELPYAPLVAALRGLLRERDPVLKGLSPATRAGLAQLVPELDPDAAGDPDDDRHRPFEALLTLLEALAEETPMILWLDDAHWADHATRAFLAFLGASLPDECRLLTVIAYRSDQLHRRHPMRP